MEGVIMARPSTSLKYSLMVFVILVCGIVSTADAWDSNVPGDFFTIQDAIDSPAVSSGDTVTVLGSVITPIVYSGTGNYNIDFKGKSIILQTGDSLGNYVQGTCIIDCCDLGRGFIFQSGENALMGARLQGFIIRNGYAEDPSWPQEPDVDASGYGGGIYIKNSSPIIWQCDVNDCTADAGGGAIFCDDNSDAYISHCNIGTSWESYNFAGWGFYEYIDINDVNDVNTLDVNDLHQLGGGIYCRNSDPWIINCNISWNIAAGSGGGIACENSNPIIRNSNISDNYCYVNDDRIDQHGGGIYIKDCTDPNIERCSIMGNDARWSGGGIAVMNSNALIENSQIYDNECWASGGGIYCDGNPSGDPNADPNNPNCIIQSCVIIHNWGYWSGGASSNYGSFADIDDCTIAWNVASWSWLVGGLECYGGGDANVAGTIIWGNTGIQQAGSAGGSALAMGAGGVEMETTGFGVNTDIDVSYSNIQMFDNEGFYDPTAVWPGEGNINKDPLFISPVRRPYDFHLIADEWNISPSINAGNPFADYSLEPAPNGNRIDMGAYGGTAEATCSDILRPVPSDADADLAVNMFDFAILAKNWGLQGENIKNKRADADNNGIVDGRDLAILHKFWLWLQ
jgi:hypothetical protein